MEEIFKDIKTYLNDDDVLLVEKAYEYAKELHKDRFRLNNEPYINHLINTTKTLITLKESATTLAAALLHDVLEFDVDINEIEKEFSKEIAYLIKLVYKINSIKMEMNSSSEIRSQKQILIGLSEDVRVVLIKLADRLDNMKSLYVLPVEKQKRKAKETLEILAPLAHRLGVSKIKSELEDYGLRYYKPEIYFEISEMLNKSKLEREEKVNTMISQITNMLNEHKIEHEIKGRAKSIYSIYNKMTNGKSFNQIYDLFALRIITKEEQDCYLALGLVHSKYKPMPNRFKDYIANPKANLYQSLHTSVFSPDSEIFEIQIRTHKMDEIAENGIAAHFAYKENKNATLVVNPFEERMAFYKQILELDKDESNDQVFIDNIKNEILNINNIYIYTPNGKVIELPKGSTPIDFAYRIHSNIGDKMTAAIVNDNIVPFNHELSNNDVVKIITQNQSTGPKKEWINMCNTPSAKSKIKSFFNKKEKDQNIIKGEETLIKVLRKEKIELSLFNKELPNILNYYKLKTEDELYNNIGANKLSPISIVTYFTNQEKEVVDKLKIIKSTYEKERVDIKNDILVEGESGIKVEVADCCMPIYGDEIIGYITKTNGIKVHRSICHNIIESDRCISVVWNNNKTIKLKTGLLIYTKTSENILADIINKASTTNILIDSVKTISKEDYIVYQIIVVSEKLENLEKYIVSINGLPNIENVTRLIR